MLLTFLPCRRGSKGVPGKNRKLINGRPLFSWALRSASEAACTDKVVLATDDPEIVESARRYDFPKVSLYDRLPENAVDASPTMDVVREFFELTEIPLHDEDLFLLVQATSPLISAEDIDAAHATYLSSGADSLLSVVALKRFQWSRDGRPMNYRLDRQPRRQDFEEENRILVENGALYLTTVGNIREHGLLKSGKVAFHVMEESTFWEIDEEDDFDVVEHLLRKHRS